jgi:hypothetical protein
MRYPYLPEATHEMLFFPHVDVDERIPMTPPARGQFYTDRALAAGWTLAGLEDVQRLCRDEFVWTLDFAKGYCCYELAGDDAADGRAFILCAPLLESLPLQHGRERGLFELLSSAMHIRGRLPRAIVDKYLAGSLHKLLLANAARGRYAIE